MHTTHALIRVGLITFCLSALPLLAQAQGTSAAAPPEIKKTVDAFRGHWVLSGTDTEPNAKPAHLTATIDCRSAALGMAVNCLIAALVPGAGRIEAASVIGYSPDEHVVRWMEISSSGEYHDHRGPWVGDKIQFEPLAYSNAGEQATESLAVGFPSPGKLTLKSVTATSAGQSILDLTGVRQRSGAK